MVDDGFFPARPGNFALCGARPEALPLDSATFEKVDETFILRFSPTLDSHYNKLKLHEGIILKPALIQLKDLSDALQRGNPAMLAINKAIAEASEQSYNVSVLQSRGGLDATISTVKLQALEGKLTELRRERRRLLKTENLEEVMETLHRTANTVHAGPERLENFNEVLFADLVERITAESQTCIRFRLHGGIELTERLREVSR